MLDTSAHRVRTLLEASLTKMMAMAIPLAWVALIVLLAKTLGLGS